MLNMSFSSSTSFSDLREYYTHLTLHIIPGPQTATYFFPLFLLPTTFLVPPYMVSHAQLVWLNLPIIYACISHTWYFGGGLDVISANILLWSTDLIALQDVRGIYKRVHVEPLERLLQASEGDGSTLVINHEQARKDEGILERYRHGLTTWDEPYPPPRPRISWVLALLCSLRMTNWKIGSPTHDRHQPFIPVSRTRVLKHALITALRSYIILDTAAFYARFDSYFTSHIMGIDSPITLQSSAPAVFRVLAKVLPARLIRCAAIAGHVYGAISLGGALGVPILLLVNRMSLLDDTWSPQSYPPFFGPFSAVMDRGVRGAWGSWWHGMMRYSTTIPGMRLSQALGFSSSSISDYALRVISAFFFSGCIHAGLVPPEPMYATMSAWRLRLWVAAFFWMQILAVGVEMAFEKIKKRWVGRGDGATMLKRVATLMWVAVWLCICLPVLGHAAKELGYTTVYPVPISACNAIKGEGWIRWHL